LERSSAEQTLGAHRYLTHRFRDKAHPPPQYVCCAEFVVELRSAERADGYVVLEILERNVGEMCGCVCGYEASALISDLAPSRYLVELGDMPARSSGRGQDLKTSTLDHHGVACRYRAHIYQVEARYLRHG